MVLRVGVLSPCVSLGWVYSPVCVPRVGVPLPVLIPQGGCSSSRVNTSGCTSVCATAGTSVCNSVYLSVYLSVQQCVPQCVQQCVPQCVQQGEGGIMRHREKEGSCGTEGRDHAAKRGRC